MNSIRIKGPLPADTSTISAAADDHTGQEHQHSPVLFPNHTELDRSQRVDDEFALQDYDIFQEILASFGFDPGQEIYLDFYCLLSHFPGLFGYTYTCRSNSR